MQKIFYIFTEAANSFPIWDLGFFPFSCFFSSIKSGGAGTDSQSLLFLTLVMDSSGSTSHFYDPISGTILLFLPIAACALKSREKSGLLCIFFSPKLYGYGNVCFQCEWKFLYQAVHLKSPSSLQPILHKLDACPSLSKTVWRSVLPMNLRICSPCRAFHHLHTCEGDCDWLGPRRLAEFRAGKKAGLSANGLCWLCQTVV